MGGLALLAERLGHKVSGSDQDVYPPMSTQLEEQGITLMKGYREAHLKPKPDQVIIGNALSRGNAEIEAVLEQGLAYTSGPQWMAENLFSERWVLAVAGTHGKTTTSSMLAWIMDVHGLEPSFLIGGIPLNFEVSARLRPAAYFIVEADEYDTAFFDKRSKFVHYRPKTAIFNNLEYDHADIFPDLAAIQTQFHHLVRTVPRNGKIIVPEKDANIHKVLEAGCWTPVETTAIHESGSNAEWQARIKAEDASIFDIVRQGRLRGTVTWDLSGRHNVLNALSAIAAAHHAGIKPELASAALCGFKNVKRRMEIRAEISGITLYDDFAHHPTAIKSTLEGLRARVKEQRIVAIVEPRSNTMRMGVHGDALLESTKASDVALIFQPDDLDWRIDEDVNDKNQVIVENTLDAIVDWVRQQAHGGDHLVFMSNGSFGGIHQRVEDALRENQS